MKVLSAYVVDWVVEGLFIEDTQYYDKIWFVMVDLVDGRTLCHEVSFCDRDDPRAMDRACVLAHRVEERGYINEEHWYFHDFFSRDLRGRLEEEAYYEDAHRRGVQDSVTYSPWYSGGHA